MFENGEYPLTCHGFGFSLNTKCLPDLENAGVGIRRNDDPLNLFPPVPERSMVFFCKGDKK